MQSLVDTIVRFYDPARLTELTRAVFSLVGQIYRPLRIMLATHNFSPDDLDNTRAALEPVLEGAEDVELTILNWENAITADVPSLLLNLGINAARGRYLGYLDYDQVLYPEAYALLVGRLQSTSAAIAFASVPEMEIEIYDQFFYPAKQASPKGYSLIDLFRANFCPTHAYLIDREQVTLESLSLRNALRFGADYDALLKICAQHRSDFGLIGTNIGNTQHMVERRKPISAHAWQAEKDDDDRGVHQAIEHRKRTTFVSDAVLRSMAIPYAGRPMTIHDIVDRFS